MSSLGKGYSSWPCQVLAHSPRLLGRDLVDERLHVNFPKAPNVQGETHVLPKETGDLSRKSRKDIGEVELLATNWTNLRLRHVSNKAASLAEAIQDVGDGLKLLLDRVDKNPDVINI
jgi:hypothetical protein